jgi:hypothetical protein
MTASWIQSVADDPDVESFDGLEIRIPTKLATNTAI